MTENTSNISSSTPQPSRLSYTHLLSSTSIRAIVGLLCLLLVISASLIGASNRKGLSLDQKRLSDFSEIQNEIADYYIDNNYEFPKNLGTSPVDPETNQPYDYKILSSYGYQLCAVFSTEKIKKITPGSKEIYNNYYTQNNHNKGYDCITYEIPSYNRIENRKVYSDYSEEENYDVEYEDEYVEVTEEVIISEPFIIKKPQFQETLCLGQPYLIEWEADNNITGVRLSLFYSLDKKTYWLKPFQTLNSGMQIDSSDPDSKLRGSYAWTIGEVESVNNITGRSGIYRLGADAVINGTSAETFWSEDFTISNCNDTSTPIPTY